MKSDVKWRSNYQLISVYVYIYPSNKFNLFVFRGIETAVSNPNNGTYVFFFFFYFEAIHQATAGKAVSNNLFRVI